MNAQNDTAPAHTEAPLLDLDADFVPGHDMEPDDDFRIEPAELAAAGLPYPVAMGRPSPPAIAEDFLPMPMDLTRVIQRVNAVKDIIARVMVEGEHFGPAFPGDKKKSLQKPGVDLMCHTFGFRLDPTELPSTVRTKEFINIAVRVDVVHIATGRVVATATGSANSREEKYRWARGTGKPTCPECALEGGVWKSKNEGEGFFCWAKKGGCGATFPLDDRRITEQQVDKKENDNAWDFLNTLEKMAFKRASMAGVITACGISNKFRGGADDDPPAAQGRRQEPAGRRAPPPEQEPYPGPRDAPPPGVAEEARATVAQVKRARQEAEVALQEVKNRVAQCQVPAAFRLLTDELKKRGAPWFSEDIKAHLAAEFAKRFPDEPRAGTAQAASRW